MHLRPPTGQKIKSISIKIMLMNTGQLFPLRLYEVSLQKTVCIAEENSIQ
jgi:hypothetical protein